MLTKIKKVCRYLWLHGWQYRIIHRTHQNLIRRIREKGFANVVFTTIDITMWRYQHLYELMANDPHFNVKIVLTPCPFRDYQKDLAGLRDFFESRHIPYIDYNPKNKSIDILKELEPDIIFYAQPYDHLLTPEYDYTRFYRRLLCYVPYSFWAETGNNSYNLPFHNLAWRLYYSTNMHKEDARRIAANKGRNVRVVGYPNADDFLNPYHKSPWKKMKDKKRRKRIIWAPHFTIKKTLFSPRSNFLWMADFMVKLAKNYSDIIQIAFKPHPSLMRLLYEQEGWGKERTEEYYNLWATMPNTQLETGGFIDLFMTSDAMVHDSSSFSIEYHYTKRPIMFVSKDTASILKDLNDFGKKAFELQYIGCCENDICRFINDIVIGGDDPMLRQREQFFNDYLIPTDKNSVAQNIINDINTSLHFMS